MTDRQFLIWLHERLRLVHGENQLVDYMHKLRDIIKATPADRFTISTDSSSISLDTIRYGDNSGNYIADIMRET